MAGTDQRLLGRHDECEALDRLIGAARTGQSQVLVLTGFRTARATAVFTEDLAMAAS